MNLYWWWVSTEKLGSMMRAGVCVGGSSCAGGSKVIGRRGPKYRHVGNLGRGWLQTHWRKWFRF